MIASPSVHPGGRRCAHHSLTEGNSMKRMLSLVAVLPLVVGGFSALTLAPAHADDRVCAGTIGATTTDDNIVVPKGVTCTLTGTTVEGNIKVGRGAVLVAKGVRVDGDIQGTGAKRVVVRNSVIDGNIQLKKGRK